MMFSTGDASLFVVTGFVLKNASRTSPSPKYAKPDKTQAKQSSAISGTARHAGIYLRLSVESLS